MAADHFSVQAAEYARFRPTYPTELFDWIAGQVARRDMAWDCACGNGQATVALADRFSRVVGTDLSATQLSHAPTLPNVQWAVAHAETSGLDSNSVELVTVAQALHWFDLPRFWTEVSRVLKPGGVIAVWSYGVFQIENPDIQKICDDFYDGVLGPFWPPERKIVEAGYGALQFPFEEIVSPGFQIHRLWNLAELLGYLSSWSATTRYTQANGVSPLPELEARLKPLWVGERHHVQWPISIRVGRRRPPSGT